MDMRQLPVVIRRQVPTAFLPNNYVAACTAIKACARYDEAAEMSNRAAAIATYAREAQDTTLKVNAEKIKLRAERRVGELLEELWAEHKGGEVVGLSSYRQEQAARLAKIAEPRFESAMNKVASDGKDITPRRVINAEENRNNRAAATRRSSTQTYESACVDFYEYANANIHAGSLGVQLIGNHGRWGKPLLEMFVLGMIEDSDFDGTLKYLDIIIERAPIIKEMVLRRQLALKKVRVAAPKNRLGYPINRKQLEVELAAVGLG